MNSDTRKYFFWKPLIVLTKMHESNKWAAQLVEQFKPCSLIARLMTARMEANARLTLLDDRPLSNKWSRKAAASDDE